MPLFSDDRVDGPIEYTQVDNSVAYEGDHYQKHAQPYGDRVETSRASLDSSNRDVNSTDKSRVVNQRVLEASQTPTEKAAASQDVPTIPGWPKEPRSLKGVSIPFLLGDLLLLLLPVAFLVLAITAWKLDGGELSDVGKTVERAMNLGPTIYPLAFAAIGSRCLRSIAVRVAETGTTISTLEKLLGSQSLVSAIGTAFTLRSANFLSIALLLLWALSPLGGQSSLRLLHETNSTRSEMGTVYYSDPAAPMNLVEAGYWFPLIPTVLGASLAVSEDVKNRPVDLWSHPKVPRLDMIEQDALSVPGAEGEWKDVKAFSDRTYSSWTGINIQGLAPNRQATFKVKNSYMFFHCEKLFGGTPEEALDYLQSPNLTMYPILTRADTKYDIYNESPQGTLQTVVVYGFGLEEAMNQSSSFFLRAAWNSTDSGKSKNETIPSTFYKQQPIKYLYGASYNELKFYQIHTCTPQIATVDAQVDCQAGDCEVTRVRKAPNIAEGDCLITAKLNIGCLTRGNQAVYGFLRYFATATTQAFSSGGVNPYDDFVAGNNVSYRTNPNLAPRNISQISDRTISDRLTTVLNTYWQAGSWGAQVTRVGLFDKPEYPWTGDSIDPGRWINTTDAVFSHNIPVYRADVGWIVSLILITIVLLLLSIVNVIMSFTTIAPDLFYYASSLACENPYTKTPDGGTALEGAERSRLLKKMKVQVADISPDNEVGYVVLKSVGVGEDLRTGRLKKGRLYW